jgi:hypothetical protein
MDKIPLETNDGEPGIRFRDCLSVRYIEAAALLCRLGYAIEKEYEESGKISPESLLRHEAFILNSIFSSVAFLESTVNELYSDAADNAYFFTDEKNEALLKMIGDKWNNENYFDRTPMINKYQKILEIAGKPVFDEQHPALANIRNLIEIRNYLMHYRREWVIIEDGGVSDARNETKGEKFEKILKNKFLKNPLAPARLPYFPDKCLGHGCAEWAVLNSLEFTGEFFSRLDLPAPYDGITRELLTK